MKQCSKCKRVLPETEFHKHNNHKDRLQDYCKQCNNKQSTLWKKNNPDKHKEAKQRYRQSEKGKKNSIDYSRKYRQTHKKEISEYNKSENKKTSNEKYWKTDKREKTYREWVKNNIDSIRRTRRKQLAKYRQNHGYVELLDNPFPYEISIERHHVNGMIVIPMPSKIHRAIGGFVNGNAREHLKYNAIWIEKLYCIDLEKILCQ